MKLSVVERFFSFVEKLSSGCWAWTGCLERKGYGRFKVGDDRDGAHRWAYRLAYGEIPPGKLVLHRCDNPWCVRPSHLYLGTYQDNVDDAVRRRRNARGEDHGMSKLRPDQVLQIREMYSTGCYTQRQLARMFNVTQMPIGAIVRGETWTDLLQRSE